MKRKNKIKVKIGDVFEIPLPNGKYAYGRVYDDAGVGIYNEVSDVAKTPPIGSRNFMFNVGLYEDILKFGEWEIIGKDLFVEGESTFPPPEYVKDAISGELSIYHMGELKKATEEECKGLEEASVWDSHHIIERIMEEIGNRK
jgi:hypothetical protein